MPAFSRYPKSGHERHKNVCEPKERLERKRHVVLIRPGMFPQSLRPGGTGQIYDHFLIEVQSEMTDWLAEAALGRFAFTVQSKSIGRWPDGRLADRCGPGQICHDFRIEVHGDMADWLEEAALGRFAMTFHWNPIKI